MAINDGHGDSVFLTWSAAEKELPKARDLARRMAAGGTTFRGCSYDRFVYKWDDCPVCGCRGLRDVGDRLPPQSTLAAHWQPRRKKAR
jgi:hypothetical protein